MKYLFKLLKDWKDHKAGDTLETEDKALFGELLADGIASKADAASVSKVDTSAKDMEDLISKAVNKAVSDIPQTSVNKAISIHVHDKSDDDRTFGYCPERVADKHSKDELTWGLGEFCKDVYGASSPGSRVPERLTKCMERSSDMIRKAAGAGLITKASGDKQQVGIDADGGFLIPPEFSLMLNESAIESAVVRPRATVIQIGSDRIEMPQPKNYDHSSDLIHGGVLAHWKSEDAQLTESKVVWEEVALNLNSLTVMAKVTHKMMRFSPNIGGQILPKMSDGIAWKEDDGFINGTGAGQPLGLNVAACGLSVAIESGQTLAATAIVAKNIDKMWSRLRIERLANCVWLYNKTDCWPWLADMKRTVGTGGSAAGLVERMAGSPVMSIYGIPLVDSEHCQALGTVGDIILCDLSQYLIADDRQGPEIASSIHLNFDYGKECFRIIKYTDGQPRWKTYFTRQKGTTSTFSPVMKIAGRT